MIYFTSKTYYRRSHQWCSMKKCILRNLTKFTGKHLCQISGGIWVRIPQELDFVGFWPWKLDVVVFQSWNLDVVAFCALKKRLGITMSWLICLRFSVSWFYGLGISMSQFFGLGISMSWYMCLHGLAFVIIVKTKKSRIIMSIMLLKNTSVVQIYATSICIMCASVQV